MQTTHNTFCIFKLFINPFNISIYADVKRINEELEYAKGIMRRLHCTIINVSNRAIEETAGMILEYVQKNKDRR